MGVGFDFLRIDPAAHDVERPAGVPEDDGHEHHGPAGHPQQRGFTGDGIPQGQALRGVGARRHEEGEHGHADGADHADPRYRAQPPGQGVLVAAHARPAEEQTGKTEQGHGPEDGIALVVGQPATGHQLDRLLQRSLRHAGSGEAHDLVAVDHADPHAEHREQHDGGERSIARCSAGTARDGFGRAAHHHHATHIDRQRQRQQAGQHRERVEQGDEAAGIDRAHIPLKVEGHAHEHIAHGGAENDHRQRAAEQQRPVPGIAPSRRGDFAAVFKPQRAHDHAPQQQQNDHIQTGERSGVDQRVGREDRAAAENEPHLIAVPVGADGIEHGAALGIGFADEAQQRAHAHVHADHGAQPDEQHAEQDPPQDLKDEIQVHDYYSLWALIGAAGLGAKPPPNDGWGLRPWGMVGVDGVPCSSGPCLIARTIRYISTAMKME